MLYFLFGKFLKEAEGRSHVLSATLRLCAVKRSQNHPIRRKLRTDAQKMLELHEKLLHFSLKALAEIYLSCNLLSGCCCFWIIP
jgi:hypothetical protein